MKKQTKINVVASDSINDFVFPDADGRPITRFVALNHFKAGLKRATVAVDGRNILVHSLRHTYNTKMRQRLTDTDLRLLTGHKDERMTERYDHAELVDRLKQLQKHRSAVDTFWRTEAVV